MRRSVYLVSSEREFALLIPLGLDWTMVLLIFLVRDSVALSSLKLPFSFSFSFFCYYFLLLLVLTC